MTSSASYMDTVRSLARAQKKAAPGAPAYSVLVNRRAGRLVAAGAYKLGMTPNMITVASALFTFSGIGLLAFGRPSWVMGSCVWLLLAVGYAFDSADGQVARLRGGGTLAGEWLDHVSDALKIASLHLAVLICAFRNFDLPSAGWLLLPIGFSAVASVGFFTMIINDHLKQIHSLTTGIEQRRGHGSWVKSLLLVPTDYGLLCFIFIALFDVRLFLIIYTIMFALNAVHLVAALVKWFGDLKSIDVATAAAKQEIHHG